MTDQASERTEAITHLIDLGSDIAGGAVGAALAYMTGGPEGAALGGAVTPLLGQIFQDAGIEIKKRLVGPREEVRIGATMAFALKKIKEKTDNGQAVRKDWFPEGYSIGSAAAKEILEGILLVAQREYEEKKLQFHGNLLANIAFHPEIDRAQANTLIRLAQRVSYRQMCLLSIMANKEEYNFQQRVLRAEGTEQGLKLLLMEFYELHSQRLIFAPQVLADAEDMGSVNPALITVRVVGIMLYELMELQEISRQDSDEIVSIIRSYQVTSPDS